MTLKSAPGRKRQSATQQSLRQNARCILMKDQEFPLQGACLIADPSGALWWPEQRVLAVADLHLEKASAFASGGVLLPPYDSQATLARLAAVLERRQPSHVLALGDTFHDTGGPNRLSPEVASRLRALVAACSRWTWLHGNHDPEPIAGFGGESLPEFRIGPLVFRHEPRPGSGGEIAGHLHPKVSIATRGRRISVRCFVTDGYQSVLPAFGTLTGGLNIRDGAVRRLFRKPPVAFALGPQRVYALAQP